MLGVVNFFKKFVLSGWSPAGSLDVLYLVKTRLLCMTRLVYSESSEATQGITGPSDLGTWRGHYCRQIPDSVPGKPVFGLSTGTSN